jgi:hypothetical protein
MTTLLEDEVFDERCKSCGHLRHCGEPCAECECRQCECAECGDVPKSAQFPFPMNTRP